MFQGTDDRWVLIPSGIVERQKAQFEGAEGATDGIEGTDVERFEPTCCPDEEAAAAGSWPNMPAERAGSGSVDVLPFSSLTSDPGISP